MATFQWPQFTIAEITVYLCRSFYTVIVKIECNILVYISKSKDKWVTAIRGLEDYFEFIEL